MANVSLRHVYKVYANGCKAVNDFNMEIKDKEFIVFVGPSGCGKSTTLRMIAGLEEISAGELYIDDVLVNDMEPKDRDISMVFQNYALYPHMTVYDNMAFGLKLRHVSQEEIHKKVLWAAKILKLTEYLDRKPRAMSGGQRQRVALGRAILRNPKVFLLDEPLSNLDAKLRTEMRSEITKLHQALGTTFIYVTHDQVEAMTLGTRVVVMKLGFVQQIDTPQNLYHYPENKFVAGFIGTPQMNFFDGTILRKGNTATIKFDDVDVSFDVDFNDLIKVRPSYLRGDKKITMGIRCENISVDPEVVKKSKNVAKVKISHFEELGSETLIYGDLKLDGDVFSDIQTNVVVKAYSSMGFKAGQIIDVAFDMKKAHFFDKENEYSICPRLPQYNVFDCDVVGGDIVFLNKKIKLPPALYLKDIKDVELFVPTDAISLNGDMDVNVVEVEQINDTQLIHVELNKRIFFIKSNEKVKVGDKLKVSFDLTKIFIEKDGKTLLSALPLFNNFVGSYTNAANDSRATKSLIKYYQASANTETKELNHQMMLDVGKLGLNDILIKEYKKELQEKIADAKTELSLSFGDEGISKKRKGIIKQECKQKIEDAKAEFEAKKKEFEAKKSSLFSSTEVQAKSIEIQNAYKVKIDAVNSLLKERIDEFSKGEADNRELFASCEAKSKLELATAVDGLYAEFVKAYDAANDEIAHCTDKEKLPELKAAAKDIKNKFLAEKENLITLSKVFFININGLYVRSSSEITKKIVNALGIGMFNVNYRYEIPLSSTLISDKGFEAKVIDMLDYGSNKYVLAESHGNKIVTFADKTYKKGDKINISFDIRDIRVYENKLDIRLY